MMASVSSTVNVFDDDHIGSKAFETTVLCPVTEERGNCEPEQCSADSARTPERGDNDGASEDSEVSRTAAEMVEAARVVLQQDCAYSAYRQMLARLLSIDDHFAEQIKIVTNAGDDPDCTNIQSFVPNLLGVAFEETKVLRIEELETSVLVDDWIEELVRFLALKALIEDVPTKGERVVGESRDDSEESSINRSQSPILGHSSHHVRQQMAKEVRQMKAMNHKLRASKHVRDAWRSLLLLPVTYRKVCRVLGSSVVEYNDFRSAEEKAASRRDEYHWTLQSYQILFSERPPVLFWPPLPGPIRGPKSQGNSIEAVASDVVWIAVNDETRRSDEEPDFHYFLGLIGKRLAHAARCMVTCGGTDNICSDYGFRHTPSEDDYDI